MIDQQKNPQKKCTDTVPNANKTECFLSEFKSNENFVSSLLLAYHAGAKDLLVPSKSKPYNEKFLKRVFSSDVEYFAQIGKL